MYLFFLQDQSKSVHVSMDWKGRDIIGKKID